MDSERTKELTNELARKFIQRKDNFAYQVPDGGYRPSGSSVSRTVLEGHLSKASTIGHYMLDSEDYTKLFAFDVDLAKAGWVPTVRLDRSVIEEGAGPAYEAWRNSFVFCPDLRGAWQNRSNLAAREYLKLQMRELVSILAAPITSFLDIPTAAAYSGNKGVHVYGFTGKIKAVEADEAATIVADTVPWLELFKGHAFYRDQRGPFVEYAGVTPVASDFPDTADPGHFFNFHIEKYPKQVSLEGKKLGNLMRLPLGRNMHSPKDPTFFIDLTSAFTELVPVDPLYALTTKDPWGLASVA